MLKLWVVIPVVAAMALLRWRRVGALTWTLAWWVAIYATLRFAFVTPIPGSVLKLYMSIASLGLFAYVTSSRERLAQVTGPIVDLVHDRGRRLQLAAIIVLLPALMAFNTWLGLRVPLEAPAFGRTVHPAPPDQITVHDKSIDLIRSDNPYRPLEQSDPAAFRQHVDDGRRVYFQNCFYCHGDRSAGDGMFAHGLNPIPSNFTDGGVLPILQESFLFWRISKGGPGLPEESGPWDTAMPAWESFLTEDEIWNVILFVYDYNGYRPRSRQDTE
jgi:hypothetical protein